MDSYKCWVILFDRIIILLRSIAWGKFARWRFIGLSFIYLQDREFTSSFLLMSSSLYLCRVLYYSIHVFDVIIVFKAMMMRHHHIFSKL